MKHNIAETNFLNAYHEAFNALFRVSEKDLLTLYREDSYKGYPSTPGGSAYDSEMKALYCMIRLAQPKKILEIGQYKGDSSNHILLAVERNGFGEVHLVDIQETMVQENLHNLNFTRHICDSLQFLNSNFLDFDFIAQDGCHLAPHVTKELQLLKSKNMNDFHIWSHDYFAPQTPAVNVRAAWNAEGATFAQVLPCVNRDEVKILQNEGHPVELCGVVLGHFIREEP